MLLACFWILYTLIRESDKELFYQTRASLIEWRTDFCCRPDSGIGVLLSLLLLSSWFMDFSFTASLNKISE